MSRADDTAKKLDAIKIIAVKEQSIFDSWLARFENLIETSHTAQGELEFDPMKYLSENAEYTGYAKAIAAAYKTMTSNEKKGLFSKPQPDGFNHPATIVGLNILAQVIREDVLKEVQNG